MRRFYTDLKQTAGVLSETESEHALKVLRMSVGDKLLCFDGKGNEWECMIDGDTPDSSKKHPKLKLRILNEKYFQSNEELNKPNIHLILSLYKFDRLEMAIEKCTEIGVDEFIITQTQFSQFDLKIAQNKVERWNEIILSACKQSERKWKPEIKVQNIEEIMKNNSDSLKIILTTEVPNVKNLKEILSTSNTKDIYILIGPEGGFDSNELSKIINSGFTPALIETNILKAETAAIVASTVAKII